MSALNRSVKLMMAAALLSLPALAVAQEANAPPIPVVEISGGYMVMHDTEVEETFPGGWYFSGAANLTRWFGLVGEAGGSYKKLDRDVDFELSYSSRLQLHTLLGGPRFFHQAGRVVPFAQVLAGVAHGRAKTEVFVPAEFGGNMSFTDSDTDFAIQPGGGVTIYLSERVGFRLAADLRSIVDYYDDGWDVTNEFRVITGLTFGWGVR